MQYRNVKTGAVIEAASVCSGKDWVEVKAADNKPTTKKTPVKTKKKDVKADE